jgi:dTDP-4-dehydrorhamnose reductase
LQNRILILGAGGMLGHKAYQVFSKEFETWVTCRNYDARLKNLDIFEDAKVINNIDAFSFDSIRKAFDSVRPTVVLNCLGIIKQLKEAKNPKVSIYVNSLFPHLLAELCQSNDSRLIHISTDCVFSGRKGMYQEEDQSDAEDLYGRSKFLGEVNYPPGLTLRTSIIGHELFSAVSLVDWFISNENGTVRGYINANYTGLPTITFVNEILRIIKQDIRLVGLYHVSSDPISKYELLCLINEVYNCKIRIDPDDQLFCDRSLDSQKYRLRTDFRPKSWKEMVYQMFEDYQSHKTYRRKP